MLDRIEVFVNTRNMPQHAPSSPPPDWRHIFTQTLSGNTEAFGQLWQGYLHPKLYPYAIRVFGNREEADDVMQTIFVHLFDDARYQDLEQQDLDSFTQYIRRMICNRHTDALRKAKHTQYAVTHETLARLQSAGVSATIATQLASLQSLPPLSQESFLHAVRDRVGEAITDQLETMIVQASRIGRRRWQELSPESLDRYAETATTLNDLEHIEIVRIFSEEIRQTLTDTEWMVFSHKHGDEDFSYQKLTKQTGIPRSTLHEHYQRARIKVLRHPKLQTYWDAAHVTDRDWRDLETARDFRYRSGQPRKAQFILTLLLKKFRAHQEPPTVQHLKAQALELSGGLAILHNSVEQGLVYYHRAYYLWKALHDREKQASALLDIAVNHANLQFAGPLNLGRQQAWRYFQAVQAILTPSLPAYHMLSGKYTRRMGYFYENLHDYTAAERAIRQSLEYFEQAGEELEEQVSRRHVGAIFLRQGRYDAAAPILEAVAQTPVLQSPIDLAKIYGLLSELAFALNQPDEGWRYFHQASDLCQQFGLHIQQRVLRSLLQRYQLQLIDH